jgi:hypothetical protein
MSVHQILTPNGVADPHTPAKLASLRVELAKPEAKLMLLQASDHL